MISILTVGDGDFSCSLALKRAYYPDLISSITATTLLESEAELVETYPHAAAIIEELNQSHPRQENSIHDDHGRSDNDNDNDNTEKNRNSRNNVTVMYNVDATKLHLDERFSNLSFDLISFHHPHLGYPQCNPDSTTNINNNDSTSTSTSTASQSQPSSLSIECIRHATLIQDYLKSSLSIRKPKGYIHLCLTGGSIDRWNLLETAHSLNLDFQCHSPFVASKPMLQFFTRASSARKHEDNNNHKDNDKNENESMKSKNNLDSSTQNTNKEGSVEQDNGGDGEKKELLTLKKSSILEEAAVEQKLKECLRAKRKGHWLGKYGYRHQPTYPHETVFETNKSNSVHVFLG